MKNKKRKIILILLVIVSLLLVVASIVFCIYYQDRKQKEAELWDEILEFTPNTTKEELAAFYNCSVEDLTLEKLEEIVKDQEEYLKNVEQYNDIYKNKVIDAKNYCIDKIKSSIFDKEYTGTWSKYNVSIIPKEVTSVGFAEIAVDPINEELLEIGIDIIYSGTGTAYSGYDTVQFKDAGVVEAILDLKEDKLDLIYIDGGDSNTGLYNISQGEVIDWSSRYKNIPYILYTEKDGKENLIYYNMEENSQQNENMLNTIPSEESEQAETSNNTSLNGIYRSTQEEEDSETYQYRIQGNKIYYLYGLETYEGTYKQNKNTLEVTYSKHYGPGGELLELDLKDDKLTIKSENELFSNRTHETYIKE